MCASKDRRCAGTGQGRADRICHHLRRYPQQPSTRFSALPGYEWQQRGRRSAYYLVAPRMSVPSADCHGPHWTCPICAMAMANVCGTRFPEPTRYNPQTGLMNWDTNGQFQVNSSDGTQLASQVVAVIFAPGAAASGTGSLRFCRPMCGGNYTASNYLDSDGTINKSQ